MITVETLLSIEKDNLAAFAEKLNSDDLDVLVDWLSEKDDKIRYNSLLLLQCRAKYADDVYKYWDVFCSKLVSDNSYQRSIGLMMIAGNVRWDKDNKFEDLFDEFCVLLSDEKPITVRQCIQSFEDIVPFKPNLNTKIAETLMSLNLLNIKETMRKLVLIDIINILLLIRKARKSEEIENYVSNALLGGLLDKKSKKNIESLLLS